MLIEYRLLLLVDILLRTLVVYNICLISYLKCCNKKVVKLIFYYVFVLFDDILDKKVII